MELTVVSLPEDELIRLRCEGALRTGGKGDDLPALLGPRCYAYKVILNLDRCSAIDTSGMSWLMQNHSRFVEGGGKLILYGVPPVIADTLKFVRLANLLTIASNETEACQMAGAGTGPTSNGGTVLPAYRLPPR
jgi:ABC-type transporter Mla MlaB component